MAPSVELGWIEVHVDELLAERGLTLTELASRIGITQANLSILKTGKAKAVRFSTLAALCNELDCQPGDILSFNPSIVTGGAGQVILNALGEKKIKVIKVVRDVTGIGLKEAKELVENAPTIIPITLARHEAEALMNELRRAGADASIT